MRGNNLLLLPVFLLLLISQLSYPKNAINYGAPDFSSTARTLVLGSSVEVLPGFTSKCFGPVRLPDEALSLNFFLPLPQGPVLSMNVYMLTDQQLPHLHDAREDHFAAKSIDEFERAFEDGACFARTGDPTNNPRYVSPSVYDWAQPTKLPLAFSMFSTRGVALPIGKKRNILLEVHYVNDDHSRAIDESRLVVGWDSIMPTRPIMSLALKDGNPPLHIAAGTVDTYHSSFNVSHGGAIFSYHNHCHGLCREAWLDLIDRFGRKKSMFHRAPSTEPDEGFHEMYPLLLVNTGDTLRINCKFDATGETSDVLNPVEMCLFYLHVEIYTKVD